MKKTLICAALIAVAFAGPARAEGTAQVTAQELLNKYDHGTEVTKDAAKIFIAGMGLGFGAANADLFVRKTALLFCLRDKLPPTPDQGVSILREYVKANPDLATYPAVLVLLDAFKTTFPCPVAGHAN
jgi:Rap1a immunity proteins